MAAPAGSTQLPGSTACAHGPSRWQYPEPVPAGPLTSHWVVSSLVEPFCSETHADLPPTHLQPLQSHPMDSSAPRALLAMRPLLTETHYCRHLSSPISSVCTKRSGCCWCSLLPSYTREAMKPTPGRVQSPAEGCLACAPLSQYLLFEESAVADWGKSPAPADPTACGPFPSCLGDPFTPYSWHLLPLPCALLRPPVLHLSPAHTGQLLQEGGEATQGVSAAPRTPTIPPQQAPNACKASVGREEWPPPPPDSVTGSATT